MALDPVAKQLIDDFHSSGRPNAHLLPVPEARANFEALFDGLKPGPDVAVVRDHVIPVGPRVTLEGQMAGGETIPARSYHPTGQPGAGLVVFFHGGGWVVGSVESHDITCRLLANASGAVVLNVGYRCAPEARFPTAVDDAWAATLWAVEHAAEMVPTRTASPSAATRPAVTSRPSSRRSPATAAGRTSASNSSSTRSRPPT